MHDVVSRVGRGTRAFSPPRAARAESVALIERVLARSSAPSLGSGRALAPAVDRRRFLRVIEGGARADSTGCAGPPA
jgi:hypothetical protein